MTLPAFRSFRTTARLMASAVCALGVLAAPPAAAQGDLLIAPTRLILDGRRGADVVLSNIGQKEATYRIALELRRMSPDGTLEEVAAADANATEQAALEMVRYAPRRVVLPPGQPQSIRISARAAPELPDGEYRVHMAFNAIPDVTPVTAEQDAAAASGGLSIKLIPIYGITIPIIVRKGRVEAAAGISGARVVRTANGAELSLRMTRAGQASTYGELRVTAPGKGDPVFMARGVAIYPELSERELTLPLSAEQAAAMRGRLRFEYREMPEAGGGVLASYEATLP